MVAEDGQHEMVSSSRAVLGRIAVVVELFGMARIASGRRSVELMLDAPGTMPALAAALVQACPELAGVAVREDGTGLLASYTININGGRFVSGERLDLEQGDSVLLFSSQAGG
jgi:molybdopterin converting factor small subunit